jgi:hypothetical protein
MSTTTTTSLRRQLRISRCVVQERLDVSRQFVRVLIPGLTKLRKVRNAYVRAMMSERCRDGCQRLLLVMVVVVVAGT